MSVGLPGPLQTAFELKNELPTPNFQPDAATLTLHALNWLKTPKISKTQLDFSKLLKNENAKSGGLRGESAAGEEEGEVLKQAP